eukprot:106586-Pelagomonas_calceolata.AAC.3
MELRRHFEEGREQDGWQSDGTILAANMELTRHFVKVWEQDGWQSDGTILAANMELRRIGKMG